MERKQNEDLKEEEEFRKRAFAQPTVKTATSGKHVHITIIG